MSTRFPPLAFTVRPGSFLKALRRDPQAFS